MFFNSHITVIRHNQGGYNNDGYYTAGSVKNVGIEANVQPLNTRELAQYTQILQGGNRSAKLVKIYTDETLKLDRQTAGQTADVIVWQNARYKVVMCEEWQSNIISHYRYIAQELISNDNE